MILNYNCYQVQQGDPAPSLGSPFCHPPPQLCVMGSVNWNWWHDMAIPIWGGGGEKQPFLPPPPSMALPPRAQRYSCGLVAEKGEGAGMDWRHLPPLGVPSPPSLVSSRLSFWKAAWIWPLGMCVYM